MAVDFSTYINLEDLQGLAGAVKEAVNVVQSLISAFSGVPKSQKTVETGQRLLQSSNPIVQALGLFWYKAGQLGIVDSSAPDIATYFKPAFDYTIQTLGIPFASPAWYALSQVIGEGQPAALFDQTYNAANLPAPMFVSQAAFSIQNPQDRYPQELVQAYDLYIPSFVNPTVPVTSPQPGTPAPELPLPVTPGQPGTTSQLDQACCDAIVAAINSIVQSINVFANGVVNADLPQLIVGVNEIVNDLNVIVNAFNGLVSAAGQGIGGLGQALQTVAAALGTTIKTAAGEEVSAISGVSQAIVTALGKIDVDTENSFAGVTKAIAAIKPVDLQPVVDELKCLCLDAQPIRAFIQGLADQGVIDPDIASLALAAAPQAEP